MKRISLMAAAFVVAVVAVGAGIASVDATSRPGPASDAGAGFGTVALGQQSEAELAQDQRVAAPRDPFKPLIEEGDELSGSTSSTSSTTADPSGTTSTTLTGGSTTSTTAGTTTTTGYTPARVTVALKEIRDTGGMLQATIEVDGVNYVVDEGDTFATDFSVVALFTDRATLSYQGRVFELRVGEMILK